MLRVVSMTMLLLTAVAASAVAVARTAEQRSAAASIVDQSGAAADADVSAEEQHALAQRLLQLALKDPRLAFRGLVVVIDLSHLTVPIDHANPGSMSSRAWARFRDRQIVRKTNSLVEAAASSGAYKIYVSAVFGCCGLGVLRAGGRGGAPSPPCSLQFAGGDKCRGRANPTTLCTSPPALLSTPPTVGGRLRPG